MDVNDLRSAVTVISLLLFLCLVAWTWSRHRRGAFDEAALLPFQEEAGTPPGDETTTQINDRRAS